jgi:hypothetical protein
MFLYGLIFGPFRDHIDFFQTLRVMVFKSN